MGLQQKLENFTLNEDTRKKLLSGSKDAPVEFEDIARIALAGYFLVTSGKKGIKVYPTCVEFYYHEEEKNGIKDPVVYHKNPKDARKNKPVFPFGFLNNHVSGIDITFEKGNYPKEAVRAYMLIREFKVDGKQESRSTMMYEALYQQASVFDGFSIKWVDGEKEVAVEAFVRKNVAEYNDKGEKKLLKDFPEAVSTSNGKYVQDLRRWQFKRK
ncbi:MAG: hypothetical protein LKI87_03965 [Prevotella sp.]|jgi:hypothetical protein|nr:hypothetical protein [Prevotella sp.]MCI1686062.1 hypothetical protein [Prevotella sp.]MCI1781492.1 hypothetical protein [Prevotella sp.]MCI1817119.1 hypothetical protein [Prevotella sp.]MCI1847973.1 hypothetical protein [Prevotella sp.]MCI2179448.1 hypothetical protein [Prevotella sp.]